MNPNVITLKMKRWTAKTRTQVWGNRNAWSLARPDQSFSPATECEIVIEIQGDTKNGYNFIMSPDGFFTADSWCESLDEAFEDGKQLFDIDRGDWQLLDDD